MAGLQPLVIKQLEDLKKEHPDATWAELGDTVKVDVPGVLLPSGWSRDRVRVSFLLPAGYPVAQPDCFWTEPDLRLGDGRTPQNTGLQQIPGSPETLLWFSWHMQIWNPNECSALTWLRVIRKRFEQLK